MGIIFYDFIKQTEKEENFLDSFPEEEWARNGHINLDKGLLKLWSAILPYINRGKFVELGCGSGIFCRFVSEFSDRDISIAGVDFNEDAWELARKNNPEYKDNFFCKDYFKLEEDFFTRFSTVLVSTVNLQKKRKQKEYRQLLLTVTKGTLQGANLIVQSYACNLKKSEELVDFLSRDLGGLGVEMVAKSFFVLSEKGSSL